MCKKLSTGESYCYAMLRNVGINQTCFKMTENLKKRRCNGESHCYAMLCNVLIIQLRNKNKFLMHLTTKT